MNVMMRVTSACNASAIRSNIKPGVLAEVDRNAHRSFEARRKRG